MVNLAEPLCSLFYMAAFLLYRRDVNATRYLETALQEADEDKEEEEEEEEGKTQVKDWCSYVSALASGMVRGAGRLLNVWLWIVCVIVAFLVKETGVTAGGIVLADVTAETVRLLAFLLSYRSTSYDNANGDNNNSTKEQDRRRGGACSVRWRVFRSFLAAYGVWLVAVAASLGLYVLLRVAILRVDLVQLARTAWDAVVSRNIPLSEAASQIAAMWSKGGEGVTTSSLYLGSSELIRRAESPFTFLKGREEKILSFAYLHFRYVYLLFWPAELSSEYPFDCIPKVSSLSDSRNWLSALAYGGVIVYGLYGTYRIVTQLTAYLASRRRTSSSNNTSSSTTTSSCSSDYHYSCHVLALAWFVVPFAPASGVFLTLGTLLAERLLYLPSLGFCLAAGYAVTHICYYGCCNYIDNCSESDCDSENRSRTARNNTPATTTATNRGGNLTLRHMLFTVVFSAYISALSYRTYTRNMDWRDTLTIRRASLAVCPRGAKAHMMVRNGGT